jgi:hypothetical protein
MADGRPARRDAGGELSIEAVASPGTYRGSSAVTRGTPHANSQHGAPRTTPLMHPVTLCPGSWALAFTMAHALADAPETPPGANKCCKRHTVDMQQKTKRSGPRNAQAHRCHSTLSRQRSFAAGLPAVARPPLDGNNQQSNTASTIMHPRLH